MERAAKPGTTGAMNPPLTIFALAERNIENIIATGG
jgi:cholesterol oxidase